MRSVGTVAMGIRTPLIKENDDLAKIAVDSLIAASQDFGFNINDRDILAVTEAVVGISEGNYVSVDDIANDIKKKFKDHIGVVYPILSRNRFSLILKGIARGVRKITMVLSFPNDEVGNGILYENDLYRVNKNLSSVITENEYNDLFSNYVHPFTGINMVKFYKELVENEGCEIEFIFSNDPRVILEHTNNILCADIHTREKTKRMLKDHDTVVLDLTEILNEKSDIHGFNSKYGLLGSNKSTEERLKLFPRTGDELILKIQNKVKDLTGKNIEVMVYGDGAFKDPVGGIWELADPVVSPAYTKGLIGTPNEIKLKYVLDNKLKDLSHGELEIAMKEEIKKKNENLKGSMISQGTTPRRVVDLVGSLSDLISGSGDKGTPIVYIKGYFDNYSNE